MGQTNTVPIVSLSEAQAFVRVETGDEEALLAGLIRTASALCEAFLNQVVIVRPITEAVRGNGEWQGLVSHPVRSITSVQAGEQELTSIEYEVEVSPSGTGWVRLPPGVDFTIVVVAGMALDENDVPEPVRQGVIRLTSHLYTHRDGSEGGSMPAIVSALWRPYRRLALA